MTAAKVNGAFVGCLLGAVLGASAWQTQQQAPMWYEVLRPSPVVLEVQMIHDSERADDFMPEEDVERESVFSATFPAVYLTEEERELLLGIAQAEANDQGAEGMALVMLTVLNRTKDAHFPDTVRDVIYQKGQFSAAKNVGAYEVTPEAMEALRMLESGWDQSHGALYFEATWVKDSFQQNHCRYLFQHGGHRFYK